MIPLCALCLFFFFNRMELLFSVGVTLSDKNSRLKVILGVSKKKKTERVGQICDRAGAAEHLNSRWWPPAARPRPLVGDWWAKLDLPSEQRWDWKHPPGVMAVSGGAGDARNAACHSHGLGRASSGMPDMSPVCQADFAGQVDPAGHRWSLTLHRKKG